MKRLPICLLFPSLLLPAQVPPDQDILLKAMVDEMARTRQLRILDLAVPYYVEYRVEDANTLEIQATLGALVSSGQSTQRIPAVRVRVGDYKLDNTNYVYSEGHGGDRFDSDKLPLENNYEVLRQTFWLGTDRAYKAAEEAFARKRSAMKSVTLPDQLPDYSPAEPVHAILPIHKVIPNEEQWREKIVRLSAIFDGYPQVLSSSVQLNSVQSTNYIVTSEGTVVRYPENLAFIQVKATGQAPDGTPVRDEAVFQAFEPNGLPVEATLRQSITRVAENIAALSKAAPGEAYDGPVLLEPRAAAQLFGQVLGENLKITRKPIAEPGRPAPQQTSELENRIGSRVLPEWMDVVDDPTQTDWHGQTLFGAYEYDMEGLSPKPLVLIEKGALKNFPLTRTPVLKGFDKSNGRARLLGPYGAYGPGFGNMFVRATTSAPVADLKKKLIELAQQRGKPYGLLIRELDFPTGATLDELRRQFQNSGGARFAASPMLVYRVYPDGHEELERGLRFRGLNARSLRDILAASEETAVLNFLDTPAPLSYLSSGFVTNAAVIAPGVLFDELELEPNQQDVPKPPIVPPPPLRSVE
ncbi:MAG TPA: metallopeptidase TldD-related protein [Bryobacteraceae bacterium]|nr:metallopeptidase TldD-related protein [Bryobacteraceae bacterium]